VHACERGVRRESGDGLLLVKNIEGCESRALIACCVFYGRSVRTLQWKKRRREEVSRFRSRRLSPVFESSRHTRTFVFPRALRDARYAFEGAREPGPDSRPPVMSHLAENSLKQIEASRRLAPEATACLRPVLETLHEHGQNASASGDTAAVQFGVDVTEKLVPVAAALAASAHFPKTEAGAHRDAGPSDGAAGGPPPRGFADDEILCSTASPVSFLSPRGKFFVHCLKDAFALESTTPKGVTTYVIDHAAVRKLLALELGDSNETTDVVVALRADAALRVGARPVKTLLAQIRGKDKPVRMRSRRSGGVGDDAHLGFLDRETVFSNESTVSAGASLVAALSFASRSGVSRPQTAEGEAFAGVGGKGCVKANVKFDQGFLFCLDDGFAFVERPSLWLPFEDLADVRLRRAEGGGSTFDLAVTAAPEPRGEAATPGGGGPGGDASPASRGESYEFANISREELEGVRRYLATNCTEARGRDAGGVGGSEDAEDDGRGSEEDDDSDEDDEDFGVDAFSHSESDSLESDDAGSEEEEEEEDSDADAGDSDADADANVSGRKRSRGDPTGTGATVSIPGTGAADSEAEEEEDEDDDDSDEDGAFEIMPVAKTARP